MATAASPGRAVFSAGVSSDFIVPTDAGVLVRLRVSPGAKSTGLQGTYGEEALGLRGAAPPVGGKASAEAERFLAGLVGAAPSEARVVRGLSARDKTVLVGGVDAARARRAITSQLP